MSNRISRLAAGFAVLSFAVSLVPILHAQDKAATFVVVREFSVAATAAWPYDVKQLRTQTIAELTSKVSGQAEVVVEPPVSAPARLYTLEGEILAWRSGNAAKRILVGMGSASQFDHHTAKMVRYCGNNSEGEDLCQRVRMND
jgi:hypothetical protein